MSAPMMAEADVRLLARFAQIDGHRHGGVHDSDWLLAAFRELYGVSRSRRELESLIAFAVARGGLAVADAADRDPAKIIAEWAERQVEVVPEHVRERVREDRATVEPDETP